LGYALDTICENIRGLGSGYIDDVDNKRKKSTKEDRSWYYAKLYNNIMTIINCRRVRHMK
jgi:hypothetical protein